MIYTLPYPPTINTYWLRNRNGSIRVSAKGCSFRREVNWAVFKIKRTMLAGNVRVEIRAFPPDRRRRDLDNVLKSLLDALQHAGVYADDSQISKLTIERAEVVKGGKVEVTISAIDGIPCGVRGGC